MSNDTRTAKTIKKKRRRKKRYLLRFFIILLLCVGAYFLLHIDYFDVNGIGVAGNDEVSDEKVIELSRLEVGENIFDIHPWFVEKRIKKNLYIADADVKRKLPDMIEIVITERTGKAQFTMGKNYVIADSEGMVIEICKDQRSVTLIEGVTVEKAKVKKDIEIAETDRYERAQAMIIAAEEGDLYFKKIVMSKVNVQAYIYDTLVCEGRYKDVMDSIEKGALKSVVFDLYQKGAESGVISVGSNNYCSFTP
ncbi:MAG: FtsQ-type POTRA domain-containing protein [Clostridiales bacterium]|nr:FtsQ-type POTRA domain-containing protein [Clostridiales bacterium]